MMPVPDGQREKKETGAAAGFALCLHPAASRARRREVAEEDDEEGEEEGEKEKGGGGEGDRKSTRLNSSH